MYSRKHYLSVLDEAKKALAGVDLEERARFCGFEVVEIGGGRALVFESLGTEYRILPGSLEIISAAGRVMPLQMRIITLHYLKRAGKNVLSGELVPLRKFPELNNYGPVIRRRSEDILVRRFGDDPELLIPAVEKLGGVRLEMGDVGGRFSQLPNVPVSVVVYGSEPGLPGEAVIMMDSTAPGMLHLEDLVVLAELLSHKLANVADFIRRGIG